MEIYSNPKELRSGILQEGHTFLEITNGHIEIVHLYEEFEELRFFFVMSLDGGCCHGGTVLAGRSRDPLGVKPCIMV
jgi:hypothetical protein